MHCLQPLPWVWAEHIDPASGKTYYASASTLKSQQSAGRTFLSTYKKSNNIRMEFPMDYPFKSPTVYCDNIKVDELDFLGYWLDLEKRDYIIGVNSREIYLMVT